MTLAGDVYARASNTYLTAFGETHEGTFVKMRPISVSEGTVNYQVVEVTRNSNDMVKCEFKGG